MKYKINLYPIKNKKSKLKLILTIKKMKQKI